MEVATVPTACGIETNERTIYIGFNIGEVATVPTACGIETPLALHQPFTLLRVATVPTACGIETSSHLCYQLPLHGCNSTYRLRY